MGARLKAQSLLDVAHDDDEAVPSCATASNGWGVSMGAERKKNGRKRWRDGRDSEQGREGQRAEAGGQRGERGGAVGSTRHAPRGTTITAGRTGSTDADQRTDQRNMGAGAHADTHRTECCPPRRPQRRGYSAHTEGPSRMYYTRYALHDMHPHWPCTSVCVRPCMIGMRSTSHLHSTPRDVLVRLPRLSNVAAC